MYVAAISTSADINDFVHLYIVQGRLHAFNLYFRNTASFRFKQVKSEHVTWGKVTRIKLHG